MSLKNFRLVDTTDVRKLERELRLPAIYAMCFDIDGQLTRVGWSCHPGQRIPNVLREQAAEVKELWIAEIPIEDYFNPKFDFNRENAARRFGRYIQMRLRNCRVRNEFFRVPMRFVDDAFEVTANSSNHPLVSEALKTAA